QQECRPLGPPREAVPHAPAALVARRKVLIVLAPFPTPNAGLRDLLESPEVGSVLPLPDGSMEQTSRFFLWRRKGKDGGVALSRAHHASAQSWSVLAPERLKRSEPGDSDQ